MSCPLCKSNDVRELECNTETTDNFENGKFIMRHNIQFLFCMDCNNIFGKRSK